MKWGLQITQFQDMHCEYIILYFFLYSSIKVNQQMSDTFLFIPIGGHHRYAFF